MQKQEKKQEKFNIGPRYQFQKIIGQGAYGLVICAIDKKNNNELVAIKKLHKIEDTIDAKRILREIRILRCLRHENILSLYNIIYDDTIEDQEFGDIYLVTNYMEIDLFNVIRSKQDLTDEHLQYILYQILRGVFFLHSANVIHRDLKPSNILANENCDVKMCDFGLARVVNEEEEDKVQIPNYESGVSPLTEYVVTRYYRAPEIMLSSHEYGKPVDIWGVGCTFAELINGKVLFPGENYIQQIKLIIDKLGKPSEENMDFITNQNAKKYILGLPNKPKVPIQNYVPYSNKIALDLLDKMLEINPNKRITAKEALEHQYFEKLHDAEDEPKFDGEIDFKFEVDNNVTLENLEQYILEEINFFKDKNKENKINIDQQLKKILQKRQQKTLENEMKKMKVADNNKMDEEKKDQQQQKN